eukprot:Em0019g870a
MWSSGRRRRVGGAQKGHAGVPVLTTFIYKLIVNLVLKEECRTVVIELDGSGLGDQQQLPSLSLTKTTDAQEFHPSFPIGEHAYCVQLQSSCSLQQLERLCAKSGDMAPPSSSAKKCWKSGMESNLAASEPNGSIKSKSLSPAVCDSTKTHLSPTVNSYRAVDKDEWLNDGGRQLHLCGGLETLAECLPALYSHNWPEPVGFKEEEKGEEERTSLATNHFKPHALLHLMPHILFHSVLMLGLCLKINCFCRSLRDNLSVSTVLLRMLLGAELTGTLAKTVQQEFSFLPYLVFHKVLVTYPSSTERGHSLRLSAFAAEKDVTTREFAVVSALETRITEAFVKANDHIKIQGTGERLLDRIDRRQLFKCVGQALLDKSIDKDSAVQIMVEESEGELSTKDFVVDVVKFDYGMKERNPVDCVWFYSKDDPTKPIKVHQNQVSHMLPRVFKEEQLRVYSTSTGREACSLVRSYFIRLCSMKKLAYESQGDEGFAHGSSYLTPVRQQLAGTRINDTTKKRKLSEFSEM